MDCDRLCFWGAGACPGAVGVGRPVKRVVLKGLALGVMVCFEKGTSRGGPKETEAVHVSCSSEDRKNEL